MKHLIRIFTFLVITFGSMSVWALSLDEAKTRGLVGEQQNGYLGVIKSSAEVEALVKSINSKRKSKYQEIASERGAALESVEKLAGKKAIEKSPAGVFVKAPDGSWKKK